MTAYDWTATAGKIDAAIVKYGQTGAIRDEAGADTPARFIVAQYDQRERDGEMILNTDLKVYLSVDGLAGLIPTTVFKLVIGGTARRIVSVDPVSPAGTVVCYILQVR